MKPAQVTETVMLPTAEAGASHLYVVVAVVLLET